MTETIYQERPPVPELATHVQSVWYQEVSAGRHAVGQRVVPDGCADALWRDGRLRVAGPDTSWRIEELAPGSFIVGVRFRPGAATLVFGDVPVSEARDREVDLADLWDTRSVRELAALLGDAGSPRAVATLLENAMVDRLSLAGALDPVVREVVSELDTAAPPPVPDMAASFGFSERRLRRRFVADVGYGPKTLHGVLRLRRAMRLCERLRWDGESRAVDVAIAAGYADQPHMTREMRRLAGITPGRLVSLG